MSKNNFRVLKTVDDYKSSSFLKKLEKVSFRNLGFFGYLGFQINTQEEISWSIKNFPTLTLPEKTGLFMFSSSFSDIPLSGLLQDLSKKLQDFLDIEFYIQKDEITDTSNTPYIKGERIEYDNKYIYVFYTLQSFYPIISSHPKNIDHTSNFLNEVLQIIANWLEEIAYLYN